MSTKTIVRVLAVVLITFLSACKPRLLPNSSIPDTKQNRAISEFMENYKTAILNRSVSEIMAMVAPDYLETNGTADPSDDYHFSQLQKKLDETYSHIKEINLRYHIQSIVRKENTFNVYYYYNQHSLIAMPAEEKWMAVNEVNRLVLKMKGRSVSSGFEIVSGL
ncbi:MAG: hypothetical protein I8H75_04550 [Myxococcaceae bacterium]|nr:hypothetical protein [Myxococcaceae bacterium]MBH2006593.1 hypothetical protein [Myxococcaceae bacterium]